MGGAGGEEYRNFNAFLLDQLRKARRGKLVDPEVLEALDGLRRAGGVHVRARYLQICLKVAAEEPGVEMVVPVPLVLSVPYALRMGRPSQQYEAHKVSGAPPRGVLVSKEGL